MKNIIFFWILLYFWSCARPCPKDIKAGDLTFSTETEQFIQVFKNTSVMEFENQNKQQLRLFERPSHRSDKSSIPIEVLCERGDFLDKTSQIRFFATSHFIRSFSSVDNDFEVNIDASISNDSELLGLDTTIYETFTIWSQMISTSSTGRMSLLSADRGNKDKIREFVKDQHKEFHFVNDTIIGVHRFNNIYIGKPNNTNQSELIIIYSKSKGVECIITPLDMWLRKS